MHVGIDATSCWNRRGFGRFTLQLLGALVERFPEHRYTLLTDRLPEPGEVPAGCDVIDARPRRTVRESAVADGRRSLADVLRFTRAAGRLAPDVLFYPAVYSFFPVPRGVRSVVCFHDTIAEDFPEHVFPGRASRWAWAAKVRLALRQCTRVMTISEASRGSLERRFGLDPARIDVVTEGPAPCFRVLEDRAAASARVRALGVPEGRAVLVFVGGISPHKNLVTLLDAMERVAAEREDAFLALVGDPGGDGFLANAGELRARIERSPALRRSCAFTGFVSDEDLVALYNEARALVLPSLSEGFGLPAVEAMACGTPVLASTGGSLPEVVGDAGLFFEARDADGMARRILELLGEDGKRDELAARALERVGRFTWSEGARLAMDSFRRTCA